MFPVKFRFMVNRGRRQALFGTDLLLPFREAGNLSPKTSIVNLLILAVRVGPEIAGIAS